MADVVQKCVSAENVNNGAVTVMVSEIMFDEDQERTKPETATESITVQEARLATRYDDPLYYSS